jgi:hypothetical protein
MAVDGDIDAGDAWVGTVLWTANDFNFCGELGHIDGGVRCNGRLFFSHPTLQIFVPL